MHSMNSKSPLDITNLNKLFLTKPSKNEEYDSENLIGKNNQTTYNNSKSYLKLSLDSTNSLSKPQLSSLMPSFSCEKNSGKFFVDNDKNRNWIFDEDCNKGLGKRKFFDFIDENMMKSNVSLNKSNDVDLASFTLNQNAKKDLTMYKEKNEKDNQLNSVKIFPINSMQNNIIPKESFINKLVRDEKMKHSLFCKEEFCENYLSGNNGFLSRFQESPLLSFNNGCSKKDNDFAKIDL